MSDEFKVGTGVVDITPPIGVSLAGGLRARKATGIGTRLFAKATVFDDGETPLAIVSVDLCVLGRDFVDAATAIVHERTGIPPERIMVTASHTHAGPYTTPVFGADEDLDRDYLTTLPRYIADAATLAHRQLRPAQIGAASGYEESVSHYRRVALKSGGVRNTWMRLDPKEIVGPVGMLDPEVGVLLVGGLEGHPISVVYNYTLHANCHADRSLIDGSYPVRVAEIVEGMIGGTALYTPGACGNINPVGKPDHVARVLSAEILKVIQRIETTPDVTLQAKKVELELPLRDFSKLRIDAIRRDWPDGEDVFTEEWRRLKEAGTSSVATSVQALALNDTAFVAVPGELFVEIGREIKKASPFRHTYVVELANDYVGYLPTRKAFDEGGYEVLDARSSKVGPEAGEIVQAECIRILNEDLTAN